MQDNKMQVQKYTKSEQQIYNKAIAKPSNKVDFTYLSRRLSDSETVFLLSCKGIFKTKVIGYAIIYDATGWDEEHRKSFAEACRIDARTLNNHKGLIINDFVIAKEYRRKGLGQELFTYMQQHSYPQGSFLLCADRDGKKFWPKLGFTYVAENTQTMYLKNEK